MNALGVDAGGSSTKFSVVNPSGEVLMTGRVAALSGHLFDDTSRGVALDTLKALRAAVAEFRPGAVVAGVTGLSGGSEIATWLRDAIQNSLKTDRCQVMGDMDLAYRAHFRPGQGILVYAGTGSIGYHLAADGTVMRAGGRGYLIDDAGGGFWIGGRALRHVTRLMDTATDSSDLLAQLLFQKLKTNRWEDLREFVYGGGRAAVAGLAPTVGEAAAQGSQAGKRILERAGAELAELARRLQGRLGAEWQGAEWQGAELQVTGLPVVLAGGALLVSPTITEAVSASGLEFTRSSLQIEVAAARMALELQSQA